MAPKRKAETAAKPAESEEPPAKRGPGRPRVRPIVPEEKPAPVTHPSHGTVPGTIFVLGDADCGQLGLGEDVTEKLRPGPVQLPYGKKVRQVAAGGMHSVALAEDGSVWSWGVNDEGALTGGEAWEKYHGRTGKVEDSYVPKPVAMPSEAGKVVQLSAGDSHTAALTEEGVVYAWGTFRSDAGVMGFSESTRLQLVPVEVLHLRGNKDRVVKIASGADHIVALTEKHRVWTWGSGLQGQLGRVGSRLCQRTMLHSLLTPTELRVPRWTVSAKSKPLDVDCGTYSTFLWTTDGKLDAWGLNNYGQLAHKDNVLWKPTQLKAFNETPVAWAKGGQHHSLVCLKDGKLMSMGRPTYGRLGRKDVNVSSDDPVPEVKQVEG
eukprot:CAMPEP_0177758854 /NCGR_PEP_ID=MMETSP0491_2-20121128/4413_1 /TAXON_ID=63592 /ORGANISM="Tetraselmis chuii, Strain PLY429" /LENGTH=376 /DNA_ID=CAMNT_0019274629 /DNA_START=108 /DNA_END=1235 /DNA_ORIENTATION=+